VCARTTRHTRFGTASDTTKVDRATSTAAQANPKGTEVRKLTRTRRRQLDLGPHFAGLADGRTPRSHAAELVKNAEKARARLSTFTRHTHRPNGQTRHDRQRPRTTGHRRFTAARCEGHTGHRPPSTKAKSRRHRNLKKTRDKTGTLGGAGRYRKGEESHFALRQRTYTAVASQEARCSENPTV